MKSRFAILLIALTSLPAVAEADAVMKWADTTRLGRPFSKDPSVIRFNDR